MKARDLRRSRLPTALLLLAVASVATSSTLPCVEDAHGADERLCKRCAPDRTKCLECWPNTGLSSDGECVPCNVTSELVQTVFGLIQLPNVCLRCDGDDPSFCLECEPQATVIKSNFVPLYATANGTCARCPDPSCELCDSLTGACTKCGYRWGAVDGECRRCAHALCLQCEGGANRCTACEHYWFADPASGQCLRCNDPKCMDCHSSGVDKCDGCAAGSFLDKGTGRCVACVEGCMACDTAAAGRCNQDACGHAGGWTSAPNGTCVRCPANCYMCANATTCQNCKSGFELWNGTCSSCGAGCATCTFDAAGKPRCQRCDSGCLPPCKPHCESCSWEDATTCTFCAAGFRPDSAGACEACRVTNCSRCWDHVGKCDTAMDGYRLTTNGTEACTVAHCLYCPDSANTCQICEPRYGLDSKANRCFACPANCAECVDPDTCLTCAPGSYRLPSGVDCAKCLANDTARWECSLDT